jgi:hypothetical protein
MYGAALLLLAPGCGGEQKFGVFNASPTATIIYPADGENVAAGKTITMVGSVADADNAVESLSATWLVDGERVCPEAVVNEGGATDCSISFDEGDKTITLQVNDPQSATGTDTITIHVLANQAPEITFHAPETDSHYYENLLISFMVEVGDPEDPFEQLTVSWESSIDNKLPLPDLADSAGQVFGATNLSQGKHLITATVTDSMGATGTDTVTVIVGPANAPPSCEIINPPTGLVGTKGQFVDFQGLVGDVDIGADQLEVVWSSDKDGDFGWSTPTSTGDVFLPFGKLSEDSHAITMTVTDEQGETCTDLIAYTVGTPPSIILTAPTPNSTFKAGVPILFSAEVHDNEDPYTNLDLSWVSSIDGVISSQGADSTGVAQFLDDSLSVGAHNLSVRVMDTDGLFTDALVAFEVVANQAPSISTVDISPNPATVDDALTCSYSGFADPEGDPDLSTFAWTVNTSPAGTSSTLIGSFQKGDTVTCEVTPNDGTDAGSPMSASIAVQNSLPTIATVSISPNPATAADTLSCSYTGFADADGDADAASTTWTVNGGATGVTTNSLSSGYSGGDTVTCTVTPYDGEDYGTPVSDSVVIDSSTPSILSVSIDPNPAVASDMLTCTYGGYADPDGDPDLSTYAWTVNTLPAGSGSSALSNAFNKGDIVTCTVTPDDGTGTGTPVADSIVIENDVPAVSSVDITPANPFASDDLSCTYSFTDPDSDPDQSGINWFIGGAVVGTGPVLSAAVAVNGDTVICEVTAFDGSATGNTDSASVVIGNSIPVASSVFISPNPAFKEDPLTCNYSFTDPDNGPDSSSFEWKVNGSLVGSTNTLSGAFSGGDIVTCIVTPNDGTNSGTPVAATILISNTAPSIASVTITPNPAVASDTLTCSHNGFVDVDGDADASTYLWTVNGSTMGSASTLSGSLINKGDTVVCQVTPGDGSDIGTPVTDSIVIDNAAPAVSSVAISPLSPANNDDLTCSYSFADPDGDPDQSQMSWEIGGFTVGSGATLAAGVAATGDTVTCKVTANDGSANGNTDSASVVIGNSTPVASNVIISPNPAYAADTLTCSYTFSDGDSDPDQSSIEWTVNTIPVGSTDNLSGVFIGGDSVNCIVTPFDGVVPGTPVVATIVISSSAPSVASVLISPDPGYETDTLTCSYSGFVDPDCPSGSCDQSTYEWLVDGSSTGVTTQTLMSGFSAGQTVTCEVTPFDGITPGTVVSDSIVIENSAPTVSAVVITPGNPLGSDDLTCSYTYSDPNNDPDQSAMRWLIGGSQVGQGPTLSASQTTSGDTVTCEVTANDGSMDGNTDTASVVIGNGAPTVTDVIISPNPAYAPDTLTCSYTYSDPEGDPDQSIIYWYVNGSLSSLGTTTLSGTFFVGDSVTCEVQAFDGATMGTVASATIFIGNSVPTAPIIQLTPQVPYDHHQLFCVISTPSTDADNETLSYTFEWFVDGVASGYAITNGTPNSILTVDPVDTTMNEVWTCTVTPYDAAGPGTPTSGSVTIYSPCSPSTSLDWSGDYSLCIAETTFTGEASDDGLGAHVAAAGDIDGDGFDDLIMSAWNSDDGGTQTGSTYLFFGDTAAAGGDLSAAAADAEFIGESSLDRSGTSSASAGDIDGNGRPELLVNAPNNDEAASRAGKTYLFTDGTIGGGGTFNMSSALADESFLGEATDNFSGQAVASAGDVDGDGIDDILISAPNNDDFADNAGKTYLFFGSSLLGPSASVNLSTADVTFTGANAGDASGCAIAGAGDLDADGLDDILISSCNASSWAGETYIFLGKTILTNSAFSLSNADMTLAGENGNDLSGISLSSAGDVDGDGQDDILIGAPGVWPFAYSYPGKVYLLFGKSLFPTPTSIGGTKSLAAADVIFNGKANGSYAGYSVAGGGDVDGDGRDDVLIGSFWANANKAGETYLWLASSIASGGVFDLSNSDATFIGEKANDESGAAVSFAGDVDGDNLDDLLIGARGNDDAGDKAGKAYLLLSPYNAPPSAPAVASKPKPALTTELLRCAIKQPAIDPEGDPLLYTFRWILNGSIVVEITDMPVNSFLDVPPTYTSPGDTWTCEIFATDGLAAAQAPSGFDEIQIMP